jgi:hypothetical protein
LFSLLAVAYIARKTLLLKCVFRGGAYVCILASYDEEVARDLLELPIEDDTKIKFIAHHEKLAHELLAKRPSL